MEQAAPPLTETVESPGHGVDTRNRRRQEKAALYPASPYVPARDHPQGLMVSELHKVEGGAIEVVVPWHGNVWFCPFCETEMAPHDTVFLAKPPKYAHMLYDIVRHVRRGTEGCGMSFAPKMKATVVRR